MKAMCECPRCGETIETSDDNLIERGECFHVCNGEHEVVKVKWKTIVPESEKELERVKKIERKIKNGS